MKIAFITTTFENTTNGPAKFARLLYEFSLKNKKDIVFFTEDVTKEDEVIHKIKIPGWVDNPGLGFFFRLFKYFFVVKKHRDIDIIVSNNTMYNLLFNLLTKKKCIGFINDDEHLNVKIKITYSAIRSYIFSFFEKYNLKKNVITIVNSFYLKDKIEALFMSKKLNLKVLYKGIEIQNSLNLSKHDDDEIFRIVFVKTNYKIGGLYTLLKALKNLDNIHLDIISSKAVAKEPLFKELLSKKITLHHKLPQNEVFKLMDEAHCVCIPSNKEALGVANMEGMIHSCVIISTNVGGIPEVLNYGEAGIMINPNDHEKLSAEIKFIKENRKARKELVLKAFDHVQNFSICKTFDNFYSIVDAESI